MMRAEVRDRIRKGVEDDSPRRPRTLSKSNPALVLHVDMDAFFAAIEERDNPSLKGKPVVVGGPKGSRGVVTTANYVAREYGVHAGMSIAEVERRCPDAIHVSTKGGKYSWVSVQLMAILRRYSPVVEPYSIDEAFLDATGCSHLFGGPEAYANQIKQAIHSELNLTASVGIGPSRIVAKMASGLEKPDGLTYVKPEDVGRIFGPMTVRTIPGVGPSTEISLNKLNIYTIDDLAQAPMSMLQKFMGKHGRDLAETIKGKSGAEIIAMEERAEDKSMGHEHTFHVDVTDLDMLLSRLLYLSEKATRRMRKAGYVGRVVTLKLRTHDFRTYDHQRKLDEWTDDPLKVYELAHELLNDLWRPGDKPIRLIGVSVSGLVRPDEHHGVQHNLFTAATHERRTRLLHAVDQMKDQYGEKVLGMAASLESLRKGW
ncbi:DNA polymerase IV [bacterium]|nr:DNA polymerase IV [bacterium]